MVHSETPSLSVLSWLSRGLFGFCCLAVRESIAAGGRWLMCILYLGTRRQAPMGWRLPIAVSLRRVPPDVSRVAFRSALPTPTVRKSAHATLASVKNRGWFA